ncbi:MAG TPA: RcpC/CpaB family pilus assembly protein [Elusimicrobiota bacterium]|nr:RcpC/CpaB family pilus assembly protein [Elusimicrobiota bacterium]
MNRKIALLSALLLSAPCARAADKPSGKAAAQAPEDDVLPMLARDPSALVLSPEDLSSGAFAISAPPGIAAPSAAPGKAKIEAVGASALHAQYRAVSVPIDESQLLGVKPGDRVDVLAVFDVSSAKGPKKMVAETMLQDVAVLGVAATGNLFGKGVITLELNPIEAQYAVLGARQADLYLAKRAPGDVALHPMEMSDFDGFFR